MATDDEMFKDKIEAAQRIVEAVDELNTDEEEDIIPQKQKKKGKVAPFKRGRNKTSTVEIISGDASVYAPPGRRYGKSYEMIVTPEMCGRIRIWLQKGATFQSIAERMGIHPRTLDSWRAKYPEFGMLFENGEEERNIQVENALFKCCMGGVTTERRIHPDGTETQIIKEIPPNANACFKWLSQRSRKWRQVVNVNVINDEFEGNPLEGMTDKELRKLISTFDD